MSRSIVPIPLFQRIGFTGTRKGMTVQQIQLFQRLAETFMGVGVEFHHGCCEGADSEAHVMARSVQGTLIHGHPSTLRSFTKREIEEYTVFHQPQPPLVRNRDIVLDTQVLIAAPKEAEEVQRSGTWATIRYARTRQRGIVIYLWPDGRIETHHYVNTGE